MVWRKNTNSLPQWTLPFPYLSTVSLESLVKLNNQQKSHQEAQEAKQAGEQERGLQAAWPSWLQSEAFPNA